MSTPVPFTWRQAVLAVLITASAGFVDGLGFLHLGGYFVSFMSGNSTRAGADLALGDVTGWLRAVGLVGAFVAGVMLSSAALLVRARRTGSPRALDHGPQSPAVWTSLALVLVAAGLATAGMLGHGRWAGVALAGMPYALAAGMGAVNGTFTRSGEVTVGLTYMTGTLVKIGQHLVTALTGGSRTAWLGYLALWSAIAAGSVAGAVAYLHWGLWALWAPVPALAGCAVLLHRRRGADVRPARRLSTR